MLHHAEKVWAPTNSNPLRHHAFGLRRDGDAAFCNGRIQPHDSVSLATGIGVWTRKVRSTHTGTSFCGKCDAEVKRMVDRREASMEPRGMDYLDD